MRLIKRFGSDQAGATSVEYAIIGSLIMIVIVAAVTKVGTNLTPRFQAVADNMK